MLTENAFVEFWGRLGKIGGEGVDGGVKADDLGEGEGEGGGGNVDMKVLAKNVDVGEMEKVLKASVELCFSTWLIRGVERQKVHHVRACTRAKREVDSRMSRSPGR